MKQFDALLEIADRLMGPHGCPWYQQQTFVTLQTYVLEEAHEVMDAVDSDDIGKITEELGDLLYTVLFYAKLGEKMGRFSLAEILDTLKEKLIRRHPHVFGETKVNSVEDVGKNWEEIKSKEKKTPKKNASLLGDLPVTLPALLSAQKILRKLQRVHPPLSSHDNTAATEEGIGRELLTLVLKAENSGIDAENALRRTLAQLDGSHISC